MTVRFLGPGDMTGMFAPRVPKLTRAVQALEPTELLIIRGRQLKALATLHPALAWALIEEMTTVLNMAHRALYARAVASARQRAAITLVDRSLAINGCLETGCRIDATQQELAVSTGTAREVITWFWDPFRRRASSRFIAGSE